MGALRNRTTGCLAVLGMLLAAWSDGASQESGASSHDRRTAREVEAVARSLFERVYARDVPGVVAHFDLAAFDRMLRGQVAYVLSEPVALPYVMSPAERRQREPDITEEEVLLATRLDSLRRHRLARARLRTVLGVTLPEDSLVRLGPKAFLERLLARSHVAVRGAGATCPPGRRLALTQAPGDAVLGAFVVDDTTAVFVTYDTRGPVLHAPPLRDQPAYHRVARTPDGWRVRWSDALNRRLLVTPSTRCE